MKTLALNIDSRGYPFLVGDIDFNKQSIFGLSVGDEVIQIGEPVRRKKDNLMLGETSSSRFTVFTDPVIYEGTIEIAGTEYAAFKYRQDDQVYHILYGINRDHGELYLFNHKTNSILIYKAKFRLWDIVS